MNPELAAICAEIEARIAADDPGPVHRPQGRRARRRYVVAGPTYPEHLPRYFPQTLAVLDAEPPDATPEPDEPQGALCGWGDFPRCHVRRERRGLCAEHAAVIRAIAEQPRPRRRVSANAHDAQPPAQVIADADVFDARGRDRVPAVERAAHMAKWISRVGRVRRADAARVAGLEPESGTMRRVIAVAEERKWVARDAGGVLRPGEVAPGGSV